MKKFLIIGLIVSSGLNTFAQVPTELSEELQIKMATQVLPEENRDATKVWGYNNQGELVVLREGTNNMVCLGDDPNTAGISISCYGEKLEPFMARGRELRAEGKGMQVRDIRKQEVEAGTLNLPDAPSMTYVLSGEESKINPETGELKDGYLRYVIYMPYATTESTGLPDKPKVPGMPWLMDPGTYRAHIMISPPKKD